MTVITNLISADNPLGSSGYYEARMGQLTEKLNKISANAVKAYKEVFLKYFPKENTLGSSFSFLNF